MMQKSDHITGINHVILLFDILDELSRCTMYKLLFITAYSIYNNGNVYDMKLNIGVKIKVIKILNAVYKIYKSKKDKNKKKMYKLSKIGTYYQ